MWSNGIYRHKVAIVYGANGFIGRVLVQELLSEHYEVYGIVRKRDDDCLCMYNPNLHILTLEEFHNVKEINLGDHSICINLAWQGVTGNKRADYTIQLENVERHLKFLEDMEQIGVKRFVGASSISETEAMYYMKNDEIEAGGRFIYSIAKLTMDYMSKVVSNQGKIQYVNAQIANVYGENGLDNLILHESIIKLLKGEETEYTDAAQWYDFIYVKDAAKALIAVAEKGRKNTSYYLGSGTPRMLREYLEYIGRYINPITVMGFGRMKSDGFNLPKEVFSTEKIENDTGFKALHPFEIQIVKVIDWYRERLRNEQ